MLLVCSGFPRVKNRTITAITIRIITPKKIFVEVKKGAAGVGVGVAGGAEDVLIPEQPTDLDTLGAELKRSWERGKRSSIIVVAESGKEGHVFTVAERVRALTGLEPRVCVFGHIQRGGTPTARDRILASRLGTAAVDIVLDGGGMMAGEEGGRVVRVPLRDTWEKRRALAADLLALVRDLV